MSVDSEQSAAEPQSVEALARELGDAIADLPEYREFEEAKRAVENHDELQERIKAFEQDRQEFMLARQAGEASQSDMEELQEAQQDLHSHPVMAEYLEAKETLSDRLEAVNQAISDPLAVDFGGEAGGCCQE